MNPTPRRAALTAVSAALVTAACLPPATAAQHHPLGNFTVNYHTGLTLYPDRVEATVIVDRAEIATVQERPRVDTDHDGETTPAERRAYARTACEDLAGRLHVDTGGKPLRWRPSSAALGHEPGEAGLSTSRLTCAWTAPADLSRAAAVDLSTAYDTRRIGWREITVRGRGLRITGTALPAVSPTGELRRYPQDPSARPLDQHSASLRTEPGTGTGDGDGGAGGSAEPGALAAGSAALPAAGWVRQRLDEVAALFDSLVGARELTVPVGMLALLLALVLGASHAVLPGHGKTLMAASLAGRRGTRRDALTVGATVTLTHTAGVLVLGLALPAATHLAGESVLTWLGAASGVLVTGIGLRLLTLALRGRPSHGHHHHHDGTHGHEHHHHGHGHGHRHDHDDPHEHPHPHTPSVPAPVPVPAHPHPTAGAGAVATLDRPETTAHAAAPATAAPAPVIPSPRRAGRGGLIGMGVAGGLVPSPSALVVLLGAVALGRTAFGVLLVLAYGLGMAATLTLAGLLLVRLRSHLGARPWTRAVRALPALRGLARTGPAATALLVVLVGLGLTARAVLGAG
ncbi:nickel transporter [Streptomyces sp. NPDC051567]|uniref:nickel transporter n=1 Tax=Streptomyces sp. NPDC051567 TaxID=3365660 RepID=UPI003793F612